MDPQYLTVDEAQMGMNWWNAAEDWERRYWLTVAGSARPVDAWVALMEHEQEGTDTWTYYERERERINAK